MSGLGSVMPGPRSARTPLLAVAGLCASVCASLLYFSIAALAHTRFEMSLYWPWLWPASIATGVAGSALSAAGFIQSVRRRARPTVSVAGMVAGLVPILLVALPIAVFFVLTLLFGA